jgi:hypothetical protein
MAAVYVPDISVAAVAVLLLLLLLLPFPVLCCSPAGTWPFAGHAWQQPQIVAAAAPAAAMQRHYGGSSAVLSVEQQCRNTSAGLCCRLERLQPQDVSTVLLAIVNRHHRSISRTCLQTNSQHMFVLHTLQVSVVPAGGCF